MKALKISLVVTVIAIIVYFLMLSSPPLPPPLPPSPINSFIERIEQEIDSLNKLSDSKFCKNFYEEINFHIETDYKAGHLGNTPLENNQWKENLTKNLYSVYANKFISQAIYVFSHSDWKIEDLDFIRSEYQILQKSIFLEKNSPVDKKFTEIQTIFSKYDKIVGFISACKGFSFSTSDLSSHFPISDVQGKIVQAATYRKSKLGDAYVNNCTRLHNKLKEIPQALFRAHIKYLDNKINRWSNLYSHYSSLNDYVNNLHIPLKNEIDSLNNGTYSVTDFKGVHKKLSDKWKADYTKADSYF
jgi:hypothetical protein